MTSKTGNNGFTLVEVMVAVAVLFIGIGGVLRAYVVSVDAIRNSQNYLAAVYLAKEKLNEFKGRELEQNGISVGTEAGNFSKPYDSLKWESETKPSDIADCNLLQVKVLTDQSDSAKEFSLFAYVQNQKPTVF